MEFGGRLDPYPALLPIPGLDFGDPCESKYRDRRYLDKLSSEPLTRTEFSLVRGHSVGHRGSLYRMVNIDLVPLVSILRMTSRDLTFFLISPKHVRIV